MGQPCKCTVLSIRIFGILTFVAVTLLVAEDSAITLHAREESRALASSRRIGPGDHQGEGRHGDLRRNLRRPLPTESMTLLPGGTGAVRPAILAPAAAGEHNPNNPSAMGAVTVDPLALAGPAVGTAVKAPRPGQASIVLACSDNAAITRSVRMHSSTAHL